jgi:lipoprotein-releasing system permease protein
MMNFFELMIAIRFLRSKRKDGFISVVSFFSFIGIALGVATLIIVMSVMNGYHSEFVKNILGIQGHITAISTNGKFTNYIEFSDEVEKIKSVEFAAPVIIEQGMFLSANRASGGVVRGIEPEKLGLKPMVKDAISFEALEKFRKNEGILMGETLAKQLRVKVGDVIKVITPEVSSTVIGGIPRTKSFKVIGTFDIGLYQYNSTTIFMSLTDAQLLYKFPNSVSEVEIVVESTGQVADVKKAVENFAGNSINLVDWELAQGKMLNALKVERNVMFLILTLIILVAVFNIVSSLIMLVKDKSKSIAILRTMGATKASIIKIFMISGSIIGLTGSLIGVALGALISSNIETIKVFLEGLTGATLFDPVIYFLTHLPAEMQVSNIALVFAISFGFSIASTIYPAYRASKLMPTEVLRYE